MAFILISGLLLFIILSAFCSGCETGIYKISKVNLLINAEHGKKMSVILSKMLEDTNALIFSILIANNICNFATTTIATYLFAMYFESKAEYYVTVFVTPVLFIFGEVLPKNIFFLRADALMSVVALPLWATHKALCLTGLTPALKLIASRFAKIFHSPQSGRSYSSIRSTIEIISEETRHEGLLSRVQRDIMSRMTNISNTQISAVMVPLEQVVMVSSKADRQELINTLRQHPYTRALVYEGSKKNITGYINLYKTINSDCKQIDIAEHVKEIKSFPSRTTVIRAIKLMNSNKLSIALVTYNGRNLGIITIKDLAEELTGELSAC